MKVVVRAVIALVIACVAFGASAETLDQKYEYARRIQTTQAIGPLGISLFGDETSYYTGSTTFTQVDVDIPGNNSLPVRVARTWSSASPEGPTAPGLFGEWELDIPYMHGVFARDKGWQVATATPNNRCSTGFAPPTAYANVPAASSAAFGSEDYWRGHSLYVPGAGDQTLLGGGTGVVGADGHTYRWSTVNHWRLRCTPLVSGQGGEGFLALSPDGTKYTFDRMVTRPYSTLQRSESLDGPAGGTVYYQLYRDQVRIYPSRIEDRFGNWVAYTYTGEQVTRIESSDGRIITLTYHPTLGTIETVTAAGRTWRYEYSTYRRLTRVVPPDEAAWTFNSPNLIIVYKPEQANSGCAALGDWDVGPQTFTMTHPSGATGVFTFTPTRHTRNVPYTCQVVDGLLEYGPPRLSDNYALTAKALSGPATPTAQWSVSYDLGCAQCTTRTTTLTNPDLSQARYTFGTQYYVDEGKLLRTESLSASAALLRDEQIGYATTPSNPPYAYVAGWTGQDTEDAFGSTHVIPRVATTITQDGATFTSNVAATCNGDNTYCFDSYARPLSVVRVSSLNGGVTDTTEYQDDLVRWVLGQVKRTTTNGIETARTDFDGNSLPWKTYAFGKLQQTLTYNSDGTVATGSDARDGVGGLDTTITLSNWKRGIPQSIKHPATTESPTGATESAVVEDDGTITSITDENGYTISYKYDAMLRLAEITYPVGDSVVWNKTTLSFASIGASEYGIPAGHWKHTVSTGNARKVTYFDAFWRPLVEESYDDASPSTTRSITARRYDADGHLIFQSYPRSSLSSYADTTLAGTDTTYDALDRVIQVDQDSELGVLSTRTEYLPGFQTRITNPRNFATTTSYMAYDQPSNDWPVAIAHPEGAYTDITRDVFGKPTSLKRRNADGSLTLTRSYAYDGYQRLCRTTEPETAAILMGYDDAGNLAWSAAGLAVGTACDPEGDTAAILARKASRTYDARNRVTSLTFPAEGLGNQVWSYTPDGLPQQITTYNETASGAPVINAYTYNKRRLLTGESVAQSGQYSWGLGYDYNANGHLASHQYPDGLTLTYSSNALGQITAVQDTASKSYATGVSYYPNGAMQQFTYGNGIVHTLTQNARGLPETSCDAYGSCGSAAVLNDTYDYDANGNVAAITDGVGTAQRGNRTMTYDGLDRLKTTVSPMYSASPSNGTASYSYDVLDNLTRVVAPGRDHYYCYDEWVTWRLTNVKTGGCGGTSVIGLDYDDQGNLKNKNGQLFEFDFGNRLREATNHEQYRYDGHGRRVHALRAAQDDTYSFYGQDGVLRYQEDYRQAKRSRYVYLNGSLVARVTDATAGLLPPTLSVPATSSDGAYAVSWAAVAGASRYRLEESVNNSAWTEIVNTAALSWSASNKVNGSYRYRARSCHLSCSAYSVIAAVTVDRVPTGVPTVTAPDYDTDGAYTVQWTSVSLATRYELEEQPSGGLWGQIHNDAATSKAVTGKATGNYLYRARACNVIGCAAWSATKTVAIELPPASPPALTVPAQGLNGSYTVTWGTAAGATSYRLDETANGGSTWTEVYAGSGQSQAFGSKGAGSFGYRIKACNPAGCSGVSATGTVSVIYPPTGTPALSAPSQAPNGSYTVSWTTIAGATRYELDESANGGAWTEIQDAAATSKAFSGKVAGTHGYRVRACNDAGCGPISASVNVEVIYPPAAAPAVSAPSTSSNGAYTVSWTVVAGATRYELDESANGGAWTEVQDAAATSKAFSGRAGGSYSYRARACNVAGCGPTSASVVVEVAPQVAPALSAPASNTTGSYTVSWTSVATATSYQLQERPAGGSWTLIHNAAGTSKAIAGKTSATYEYEVRACNAGGCGPYSAIVGVAVALPPPPTPTGLYAEKEYGGSWTCTVTWNAAITATSYQLREGGTTTVYNGPNTSYSRASNCSSTFAVRACSADGCSAWSSEVAPIRIAGVSRSTSGLIAMEVQP